MMKLTRAGLHVGWAVLLVVITSPPGLRRSRPALARRWCGRALGIIGIELTIKGVPASACLHVANHITWLDVPVMMAAGCQGFVSKSEVANWPLIGRLVRAVDTVFIERGGRQTNHVGEIMHRRLANGQSVLFFPEGTTTDGRRIRQFHARLFGPAISSGSRVQPLAIRYEAPGGDYRSVPYIDDISFVENLLAVMRQPRIRVELTFCLPIQAAGYDRKRLAREARNRIAAQLALNDSLPDVMEEAA